MKIHVAIPVTCLLLVAVSVHSADHDGKSIAESLQAAVPSVPMTPEREKTLRSLDDWLARPGSERDEAIVLYYRAAVDRALDHLEKEQVASGARIFQLYSSSVIVQTPRTVFAFDLDQGPNQRLDRTPAEEGTAFCMTDSQIARLASLVEVSFHTHEHDDHVDFALTQAFLKAGKTVITTESNKARWAAQPWAKDLTVLKQTLESPIEMGPLKVDVLWDQQWGDSRHTSGTPCNAFLVTTADGVTVMTKGDVNCGLQLYGWLSLLKQRGRHIDAVVGSPIFWRGVSIQAEWDAIYSPLWLPGHAWEFGHRRPNQAKGNCAGFVQSWQIVKNASRSDKVQVLSWGEWIDVPAKQAKNSSD